MKKISHRSGRSAISYEPISLEDLPSPPSSEESGAGDGSVGRNLINPGESVVPAAISELEEEPIIPARKGGARTPKSLDYKRLTELLVALGDSLDEEDEPKLASFADFLINKIAQQNNEDYSSLLNDILIKVSDSDIPYSNGIVIKIVKYYSRIINFQLNNGNDIKSAKRIAYQKSVNMANKYVL